MKFKKTLAAAAAVATAVTMCASTFTACTPECEHAYTWTVITPATCISEGERQGVCGLCGDVTSDPIPVLTEHPYGEWEITPPTEQTAGKAVKTCTVNNTHEISVTLPVITAEGTGYLSSEVTKPATSISNGERTFVLGHEEGNIEFTVQTPVKSVETAGDAVLIASTKKELVRSVSGTFSIDTVRNSPDNYFYEFGDNYIHSSDDGDNTERWGSIDENGNIYMVFSEFGNEPRQATDATAEYMNGFRYTLGYTSGNAWYGAEGLLKGLYDLGALNTNRDFVESSSTVEGEKVYKFQFGTHNDRYYTDIFVKFTLYDNYAIKTLDVNTEIYDTAYYEDPETHENNGGTWVLEETEDVDDLGNNVLVAHPIAREPNGRGLITAETVLRTPEDEVPVNPYTRDNYRVKSFKLYSGATEITQEAVNISANSVYQFNIREVVQFGENITGNIAFDPVTYWLRTEEGDTPVDFDAPYDGISVWGTTTVNVRSFMTGEVTLVLKTTSGSFEKELKLNISKIAPPAVGSDGVATFFPSVYMFGGESYYWQSLAVTPAPEVTVFTNQPLKIKADVPQTMLSYVDPSATAAITSSNAADASITATDEENVYAFTATKTGEYEVTFTSTLNPNRTIQYTLTVTERPEISTVLVGEYTGSLSYPQPNTVKVTFNSNGAAKGTVTVSVGTIGTETLNYTWDETTYTLTTTYSSGRNDAANGFGFSLTLNEAYNLVVTHPRGVGEDNETVVVYNNARQ